MEQIENRKMRNQIIIAITLMILILLLVFFVHESKSMTQKEVSEVMSKSNDYRNFSMKVVKTESNTKEEKQIKIRNNIKVEKKENSYLWLNYETGEKIEIDYNEKTAILETIEKQEYQFFQSSKYKECNYKYLGDRQEEGKEYADIAYKNDKYYLEVVLDKQLGINIKEQVYNLEGKMKKGTLKVIYEVQEFKLNDVTEQEVERPNLIDYKVIDKRG